MRRRTRRRMWPRRAAQPRGSLGSGLAPQGVNEGGVRGSAAPPIFSTGQLAEHQLHPSGQTRTHPLSLSTLPGWLSPLSRPCLHCWHNKPMEHSWEKATDSKRNFSWQSLVQRFFPRYIYCKYVFLYIIQVLVHTLVLFVSSVCLQCTHEEVAVTPVTFKKWQLHTPGTFVCVADSYLAAEFSLRAEHLPAINLVLG